MEAIQEQRPVVYPTKWEQVDSNVDHQLVRCLNARGEPCYAVVGKEIIGTVNEADAGSGAVFDLGETGVKQTVGETVQTFFDYVPRKEIKMDGMKTKSVEELRLLLVGIEGERDAFKKKFEQERADNGQLRMVMNKSQLEEAKNPSRELQQLKERAAQLEAFLAELQDKPLVVSTVQKRLGPKRGIIAFQGNAMEVNLPEGAEAGDQVMVLSDTGQPMSIAPEPVSFGVIVTVERVQEGRCFFEGMGGGQQSAFIKNEMAVNPGDRVQLDATGVVAMTNLGRDKTKFSVETVPDVTWDDVGGHEEAKEAFREALEYPLLYKDTYAAYGATPSKGALLYGPPGTGKTLLAKAAANSVSKSGTGALIYVKGAEILSKWVGEAEASIRALFARAKAHKRETGSIALIFIDEADAILGIRGGAGNALTSTLVPSFLAEMDGMEDNGAFLVLATNRPDGLDPAVVRDGRIDRRIRIGRPDRKGTEDILRIALKKKLKSDIDYMAVADHIWSPGHTLYELDFPTGTVELGLKDMVSGATIAGFVNRATTTAMRRDRGSKTLGGITTADLLLAVDESFRELAIVSPNELILEKIDQRNGEKPRNVRKVQHARSEAKIQRHAGN
jgi:proteasome-associated ATPase